MDEKCGSTKRDLDKNFDTDKIYIIFRGTKIYIFIIKKHEARFRQDCKRSNEKRP